jgi:uncharacterized membrane-anchored protein
MKKNRKWQLLGVVVMLLVLMVGLSLATQKAEAPENSAIHSQHVQTTQSTSTASITIEGWYDHKTIPFSSGITALEALQTLNTEDPALHLTTKEYRGLGTLVESMAGRTNGTDQKYWQYKVNGTMPEVGAGAYILKNNDSVEWLFEASEF